MTSLDIAQNLAKAGFAVFPCGPDKRPLEGLRWRKESTTDPRALKELWTENALPAIDCGKSGLVVIDCDKHGGPDGVAAFLSLQHDYGGLPYGVPEIETPSGGCHLIFAQPHGEPLGNKEGDLPDGINVRGDGGYVIACGAALPDGRAYRQIEGLDLATAFSVGLIPTLPKWLEDIIRGRKDAVVSQRAAAPAIGDAYARSALEREVGAVACAPEGGRNNRLNQAAFNLGQLVASGGLNEAEVRSSLQSAAEYSGLGREEIAASISSGLRAGLLKPRERVSPFTAATGPKAENRAPRALAAKPAMGSFHRLMDREFAPVPYVVPGYIAAGATILAGKPKIGKSWLVLEMALAVASGGTCLGSVKCEQGSVLYLALEDNERRLQSRGLMLAPKEQWPACLHYSTEWPRAEDGGLKYIADWLDEHKDARLIIVDVLAMFRSPRGAKDQLYESDYAAIKGLQKLASEHGVAIVIVHHTRKSGSESDPFEKVSGTLGLSGAADSTLILDRDANGVTLYGRGRDIPEIETAITFDKAMCRWRILGPAVEVRRTDERTEILDLLKAADEPMSPADIADALGLARNTVKVRLFRMATADEIVKSRLRGRYRHPDRADLDGPVTGVTGVTDTEKPIVKHDLDEDPFGYSPHAHVTDSVTDRAPTERVNGHRLQRLQGLQGGEHG